MKMTRAVRGGRGRRNVERLRRRMGELQRCGIRDALELGCGAGTVSAFLADEYGMAVWGADVDPARVEEARRRHPGRDALRFEVEDASRLSFPAESFDLIVAQNVFRQVPNWEAAVRETARVLRPGGYMIWEDLAWPWLMQMAVRPLLRHAGLYSLREIREAFADSGLDQRAHERFRRGPVHHHELLLEKRRDR